MKVHKGIGMCVHLHARSENVLHIHFIHIKQPLQLNVINQTLAPTYSDAVQRIHASTAAEHFRKLPSV